MRNLSGGLWWNLFLSPWSARLKAPVMVMHHVRFQIYCYKRPAVTFELT